MDRFRLINHLIIQTKAKKYLEVSIHNSQSNLAGIKCSHKKSSFPFSSDVFFKNSREKFDIIFIDGFHTEEQVLKDVANAFKCLNKGGIIILHDCMPPDAWHQREPEEYKEGENWNGTVWKAALRIFNESMYKCILLDADWGCGIIDTSKKQVPKLLSLPEKLEYAVHYAWLLNYKKTPANYIRDQVTVFYHLACMGNWEEVFSEQMQELAGNNFKKINITVLGNTRNIQQVKKICGKLKIDAEIIFSASELTQFETPAFLAIEKYVKENGGYVLYLHSKGVSNPADISKAKWRRLMMRELVENWENCMLQLPDYDAIGVNWREMPPSSHFCGNFWYASTQYLRNLSDFTKYYNNPRYTITDSINSKRLGCEFWISSSFQKPHVLSLFCRNEDFCNHEFWRNR